MVTSWHRTIYATHSWQVNQTNTLQLPGASAVPATLAVMPARKHNEPADAAPSIVRVSSDTLAEHRPKEHDAYTQDENLLASTVPAMKRRLWPTSPKQTLIYLAVIAPF